jgi:hypothetical protein
MTKAKMIETIQNMESEMWLEYNRYSYYNAPKGKGYFAVCEWQSEDNEARSLRSKWAAFNDLLEKIGETAADNEANNEAFKYHSMLYKESKETA